MRDEDHRSEADVLESVDRKDYRRRSAPTDPLNAWGELLSFTTFCCREFGSNLFLLCVWSEKLKGCFDDEYIDQNINTQSYFCFLRPISLTFKMLTFCFHRLDVYKHMLNLGNLKFVKNIL